MLESEPAGLTATQRLAIDRIGATILAAQPRSGFSLRVVRSDVVLYARGFGRRSGTASAAVDADTIFPIGSITKQFTAAAVEMLALDGALSTGEKLARYVPDAPHARNITIRQLLTQTSGLANYTAQPQFLGLAESTTVSPHELLATIAGKPLGFVPGTRFEYSNTNYIALGAAIEAITEQPYGTVIRERIAAPLSLTTLTFEPPIDTANAVRTPWTPQATFAAGGLSASPADISRWDAAFFAGDVLPPATVAALTTPPSLAHAPSTYACGWIVDSLDGRRQLWHNGGVRGASTRNCWFPDSRIAVVVFGNSLEFDPGSVVRAVMRVVEPPSDDRSEAVVAAPAEDREVTRSVRREYLAWASGAIDVSRYTAQMRAALDDAKIADVARGLASAGAPTSFTFIGRARTGSANVYRYRVETPQVSLVMTIAYDDDEIAGIFFAPA